MEPLTAGRPDPPNLQSAPKRSVFVLFESHCDSKRFLLAQNGSQSAYRYQRQVGLHFRSPHRGGKEGRESLHERREVRL